MKVYRLLISLESLKKGWLATISVGVVLILGLIDYITGFELSFSFFYLLPITIVAWTAGREAGLVFSALCASIWFTSNLLSGQTFSSPFVGVWNTLVRFGFYAVVTILLVELRHALEEERILANTDPLTGALNRRSFNQIAEKRMIISEVNRHPYTMVYFDLDNFKLINDRLGHSVGDLTLRTVAETIQSQMRNTDFLARLGGDEFAILLTDIDQKQAKPIVERIQMSLLDKMKANDWEVTFSIGALTVLSMPNSTDHLVSLTDTLMYAVKTQGKNAIQYSVYGE
jgi:diguanylate cyclase (GGDEF)-like protein